MPARSMQAILMGLASAAFVAAPAFAEEAKAPTSAPAIEIVAPWIMATPPSAKVGGAFMTIKNTGAAGDRLTGAKTDVAGSVEIHEMKMVNGVMMMSDNHPGITVAPKTAAVLKPFANHLMLMDLKRPLTAGEKIKVELNFEKAGTVAAEFNVEPIGSTGPDAHAGHAGH